MKKQKRLLLQQALFLCLTSGLYTTINFPALSGGFILDDWPNLEHLSQVHSFRDIWAFTFSGVTGNPGRPLAYFTFALQAEHWPHSPYPFKLVNLGLHIFNAFLVYLSCLLLSRLLAWPIRSRIAFAGTVFVLWLFLPLNISTVFYIVQRMTLLAGLFSLLGVLAFLWGMILSEKQPVKGFFVATAGIGVAYIAGILCKENAVLVGLYVTVIYYILLRDSHKTVLWDRWVLLCGVLPTIIVFGYILISERYLSGYSIRHFNLSERLMTEAVIVWDYVGKMFFPTPAKLNIFNDDFPVSRNLTEPLTLASILGWFIVFILVITFRKKAPFISFGILWFLSGHLMESTFLGLELYFEHRNYIPSLGLLIGLTGFFIEKWHHSALSHTLTQKKRTLAFLVPAALCLWFIVISGLEIQTWRSPRALAISSLNDRPNSLRARQEAAAFFANTHDYPKAAFLLATIEQTWPVYPGNYAQMLMLKCLDEHVVVPDFNIIEDRFRKGRFDRGTSDAMHQILQFKKQGRCQFISWPQYRNLLNTLLTNPKFNRFREDFVVLIAFSHNAQKKYQMAAESLEQLPETQGDIDFMLLKAQFNAMAGNDKNALQILDRIRMQYKDNFKVWAGKQQHVDHLQNLLEQKLTHSY